METAWKMVVAALIVLVSGTYLLTSTISGDQTTDRTENGTAPTTEPRMAYSDSLSAFEANVRSGGQPKDGIPAIDDPSFIPADQADETLAGDDIVLGVIHDGVAKAYPQSILVWHEIVNDEIGGKNVAVTYCPLTGTAIGYERGSTTFGTTGRLLNSNLVMYDRASDSWFPQITGTAFSGPHRNKSLTEVRVIWTTWDQWKAENPETQVLSEDTGYVRNYDQDPYGSYTPRSGYYAGGPAFSQPMNEDDRLGSKDIVIGARTRDGAMAFEKDALRDDRLATVTVNDQRYLAAYDTALDTAYVYTVPDGTTVTPTEDSYRVDGTTYSADALPFEAVNAFDAMWHAWAAYYPDTALYR